MYIRQLFLSFRTTTGEPQYPKNSADLLAHSRQLHVSHALWVDCIFYSSLVDFQQSLVWRKLAELSVAVSFIIPSKKSTWMGGCIGWLRWMKPVRAAGCFSRCFMNRPVMNRIYEPGYGSLDSGHVEHKCDTDCVKLRPIITMEPGAPVSYGKWPVNSVCLCLFV